MHVCAKSNKMQKIMPMTTEKWLRFCLFLITRPSHKIWIWMRHMYIFIIAEIPPVANILENFQWNWNPRYILYIFLYIWNLYNLWIYLANVSFWWTKMDGVMTHIVSYHISSMMFGCDTRMNERMNPSILSSSLYYIIILFR